MQLAVHLGSRWINARNGLCLSALHDKAFDRGLITSDGDFSVMLSKELEQRNEPFVKQFFIR